MSARRSTSNRQLAHRSARPVTATLAALGLVATVGATSAAALPSADPSAPVGEPVAEARVIRSQEFVGKGSAPRREHAIARAKVDAYRQALQAGGNVSACSEAREPSAIWGEGRYPRPLPPDTIIVYGTWTAEYHLGCDIPGVPQPDPHLVDLVRYRIPGTSSYASSVESMPNPPYVADRDLGRLLLEPAKDNGTHLLYQCKLGWYPPRTTTDPNFGDCTKLGFAYDAPEPLTQPLYRCPVPELGRGAFMDSNDRRCEGRVNGQLPDPQPDLLGYVKAHLMHAL